MKLIRDYISKPSEAVQLMIDGLRNQSKRPDFVIDMSYFGGKHGEICCGCAAACALQEMTGINFTSYNIGLSKTRAKAVDIVEVEVDLFEDAIDDLRAGSNWAFSYKISKVIDVKKSIPVPKEPFYLHTHNWEEQLPLVEKYVEQLKAAGL